MARAAQHLGRVGSPRDAGNWPVTGCGMGKGTSDGKGDRNSQATAPWDWETSRHGVVNHGPTMGNLTTGSRKNALSSGTAVRCPHG